MDKPTRKPDIVFKSTGRINISRIPSIMLDLNEGDIFDLYFEPDTKELYAYVFRPNNSSSPDTRYTNVVKQTKPNCHYMRVQSVALTSFVLKLVGAPEAHLFCGSPKPVSIYGITRIAVPIVWRNNQYNKQK